jgi:tetratricopeptide (TPR) repeat protein
MFKAALRHQRAGRLADAVAGYQALLAVDPGHGRALHLLGVIAYQMGQVEPALNLMRAALDTDRRDPGLHNDLGEILRLSGHAEEAETHFEASLELDPRGFGATNNLGLLRHAAGRLEEAITLYRRAITLDKHALAPRINLAVALTEAGHLPDARAVLKAARKRAPENAALLLAMGNLREAMGEPEAALHLFEAILKRDPSHVQAESNLARVLRDLGRPAEALDHYEAVLRRAPDLAQVRFNQGVCRLLLGDYERGWDGWAWRWRAGAVPAHGLGGREWVGERLQGAPLLVHAEQGIGDTIQFARFLPHLKALGAGPVTLLVQPGLARLLAGVSGVERILEADADCLPFDRRIPLLDLGARVGSTPATLDGGPYLAADPVRATRWRSLIAGPGRRVGLVWRGRPEHANDRNRSTEAASLRPLLDLPGFAWFSLQLGMTEAERAALPGVTDLSEHLTDWSETAAAIATLDLVVTVDTSVAHLAGALGRPIWILLPFAPDWRWMLKRSDSPWYASARLFRQSTRGDWPGVIDEVGTALMGS